MLLAQLSSLPLSSTGAVTVYAFVALCIVDRVVSIVTNLRHGKDDVMPRAQVEGELCRLDSALTKLHDERRGVDREIFDHLRKLESSLSNSFNDLSRTIGQLEGRMETTQKALTDVLVRLNRP